MTAIGDTAAATLIARAEAVGITIEDIAKKVRLPYAAAWAVANISGRDWTRIDDMIAERESRTEEAAPAAAAPLATAKQIDYIMSLLAGRARTGEEGGFMTGPTTREGVAKMTRTAASNYISSLKGGY